MRTKKGFTQKEIGELLEMSGKSYSKYEYGLREPNIETLIRIQSIFDEPLDFMVGISDLDNRAIKLRWDYDHTYSHYKMLDEHISILLTDPSSKELFSPVEPKEVSSRIQAILEVKPGAHERFLEAKKELLIYLKTLPCVKETTIEKIEKDTL